MNPATLAAVGTAARATRGESVRRGVGIFMSSANSWYVQTAFGAVLGPMPDETLAEMARTGALLMEDLVRKGADGDWHPASSKPDLFDGASSVIGATSCLALAESPRTDVSAETRVVKTLSTADTLTDFSGNATQEQFRIADSVEPDSSTGPLGDLPRPAVDLIKSWKAERSHTREQLGLSSLADESATDNGAPLDAPGDSHPDLFVFESHTAKSVDTTEPRSPAPSIRPTSLRSQTATRPQKQETFPQKWDRWKRSFPSWPIGIACVVVVAMIWWYWPRSTRGIYDRYVAIWNELKTRRIDFKDKEGWEEFLERSKADLNEIVPWLETRANSRDREKQLLLWIGRDCLRPMLKRPRVLDSAEEKQLRQHLNLLGDFYSGTTSTEPRAVQVNAGGKAPAETDPEQVRPGVLVNPSALRKSEGVSAESSTNVNAASPNAPGVLNDGSRQAR